MADGAACLLHLGLVVVSEHLEIDLIERQAVSGLDEGLGGHLWRLLLLLLLAPVCHAGLLWRRQACGEAFDVMVAG